MKNYKEHFESSVYAFRSEKNILDEKDLGIVSNVASVMTPWRSVSALSCFQSCPYTNTAFDFDVIIDGETVRADSWTWLPNAILRRGEVEAFSAETVSAVVPDSGTVVQKLTLINKTGKALNVPLQIAYRGGARREDTWTFKIPAAEKAPRDAYSFDGELLSCVTGDAGFFITSSLDGLKCFARAYLLEREINIPANGELRVYFSAHSGESNLSKREAYAAKGNYENLIERSFDWLISEEKRIYDNLPRLSSDSKALDTLYYRSLVTYILCRWENPELCAMPYFSTGSVNGACMCSYLWDYCGGLMIHPIYDPEGNKAQLRAYLRNDLTTSYALNPVTSGAIGPWYQINQEKIILMVYYHVLATGEREFLFEKVGDKTVLDWMLYHAYVCDDTDKDVELYDYGEKGNDHLELKRWGNGPYNGIMPDLNARRYLNYTRVYELTCLAGQPDENLLRRAEALREKLKALWNEDERWYDFIDADGNRDIRYTVQMFKFINSPVIGEKEREGLISHLNEREFLSKFGLHSMSKLDPQYDQDDIDNGGGGICTHFTTQICGQLYEMGYDSLATDILGRIYWWGERMPYMGDSCAANMIKNREDTPLQGDISSTACAQMIFYFIFGIRADFDGNITVSPVKHRPAYKMKLDNIRLAGKVFSVCVDGDRFTVDLDGKKQTAKIGETIKI